MVVSMLRNEYIILLHRESAASDAESWQAPRDSARRAGDMTVMLEAMYDPVWPDAPWRMSN